MSRFAPIRLRSIPLDVKLAVFVFMLASIAAWAYTGFTGVTPGLQYGVDGDMFVPPAMFASGNGLYDLNLKPARLQEFLDHKIPAYSPIETIPSSSLSSITNNKFLVDRYYLLYMIGWIWRIFGISWASLNIVGILFFGLLGVLAFGLFRLGLNRILSLICTSLYLASPILLNEIPALRDFCKAPFILAAILATGYVLSKRMRFRALLFLACVMGLLIGVGVGFRQDSIICLPPLLFVFLMARYAEKVRFPARMLPCGLMLACFLFPAWPVLKMNRETAGNNAFYLTQGFTFPCLSDLGMERASYAPLYSPSDHIVHAYINYFDQVSRRKSKEGMNSIRSSLFARGIAEAPFSPAAAVMFFSLGNACKSGLTMWGKESELVARQLVGKLLTTFPGDAATRCLASPLRLVRGLQSAFYHVSPVPFMQRLERLQQPLANHLGRYGLVYAAAALLLLNAGGLRLSFGALGILLYFGGYPSLEFQLRHAFHLHFIAYWIPGFLLSASLAATANVYRHVRAGTVRTLAETLCRKLPPFLGRATVFSIVTTAVLCGPLQAARFVQQKHVSEMVTRYTHAELDPITVKAREQEPGRTLYAPADAAGLYTAASSRDIDAAYLAVEFESSRELNDAEIHYETGPYQLGGREVYRLEPGARPCTLRYFFPVFHFSEDYEKSYQGHFPEFEGIVLPSDVQFKGLYRVRNIEDFPILMTLWLPSDLSLFKPFYGLPFP